MEWRHVEENGVETCRGEWKERCVKGRMEWRRVRGEWSGDV